jgi:translation elongation factor EF-1beta
MVKTMKFYPQQNRFPSRKVNTPFTQHLFKLRAEIKKLKAQVLAKSKRDHERLFERQTIITEWSSRAWTSEERIELATECLLAFENELTWPGQTPEELDKIRGMIAWERKELKILEHEGEIEKLKEELKQAWAYASARGTIAKATEDKLRADIDLKDCEIKAQYEVIAEKDAQIAKLKDELKWDQEIREDVASGLLDYYSGENIKIQELQAEIDKLEQKLAESEGEVERISILTLRYMRGLNAEQMRNLPVSEKFALIERLQDEIAELSPRRARLTHLALQDKMMQMNRDDELLERDAEIVKLKTEIAAQYKVLNSFARYERARRKPAPCGLISRVWARRRPRAPQPLFRRPGQWGGRL